MNRRLLLAGGLVLLVAGVASAQSQTSTKPGATSPPAGRFATAHGFTISEAHPRLWFTPARLAQARRWLADHPFTPAPSDHLHIAWKHAVAGADCSRAIEWALHEQVPERQFSPRANGSDVARWNGLTAALIYDWCHDQLTPGQRTDLLGNVAGSGKGWNDYLAGVNQQEWGGARMTQSNYNWGNLRNDLAFGIATFGENRSAAEALLADGLVTRWAKAFVPSAAREPGGVSQEGTAYGACVLEYPIVPFITMGLGGRDPYTETGFFEQAVFWLIYGTSPAPTASADGRAAFQLSPFSDDELFAEGGVLSRRSYYQDFMHVAAGQWNTTDVGRYAQQWLNTVGSHPSVKPASPYVRAQFQATVARPFTALPLDYYATGVQHLFGRKAWDTGSTWFHWQLGKPLEGGGHWHTDVGNLNIWRAGRWLTRESTGYSDSIAGYGGRAGGKDDSGSIIAHNGLVFGTPLYIGGTKLMPSVDAGQSVVRRLESRPGWAYADVDMTNRYRWSWNYAQHNGGAVVHVERELLFLRELETTVVLDRLTSGDVVRGIDAGKPASDQVTTFVLHFETNPVLEDATHLTARNGDQALRVTTLVPARPARRVIDERACAGCSRVGLYRVELDTAGAAQRYFLHVLQGRDVRAADVVAAVVDSAPDRPEAGTFTVSLRPATGPETTIVFEKGRTSRGGTVRLPGSPPVALGTAVQGIRYTDRGPEWEAR
jgi:hypothetical protein